MRKSNHTNQGQRLTLITVTKKRGVVNCNRLSCYRHISSHYHDAIPEQCSMSNAITDYLADQQQCSMPDAIPEPSIVNINKI